MAGYMNHGGEIMPEKRTFSHPYPSSQEGSLQIAPKFREG